MKTFAVTLLYALLSVQQCEAHNIHSKANFYGAGYSALIKIKSYRQLISLGKVAGIEAPYIVHAETLEVFHGNVPRKFEYIYWGPPGGPISRGIDTNKPVILSFCKSRKGVYYIYDHCCPTNLGIGLLKPGQGSGDPVYRPSAAGMRQQSPQGWVLGVSIYGVTGFMSVTCGILR